MPKDILIVDDDSLVCDSLKEMLTFDGYAVDTALSAAAALTKVNEEGFHLILSDIQMPGMNGIDLLKEIKGQNSDALVVFITGHGHIDGAVEAIKLGAYDYITKPIDDLRLRVTIQRALEQHKLIAEEAPETLGPAGDPAFSGPQDGAASGTGPYHRRHPSHRAYYRRIRHRQESFGPIHSQLLLPQPQTLY